MIKRLLTGMIVIAGLFIVGCNALEAQVNTEPTPVIKVTPISPVISTKVTKAPAIVVGQKIDGRIVTEVTAEGYTACIPTVKIHPNGEAHVYYDVCDRYTF